MALNLEKQLTFYGAYHHDPINIAIHIIFVPLIMFTGLMFGTNTPNLTLPSDWPIADLPINLGTVTAALYSVLYILMEPVAGSLIAPLIMAGSYYGSYLTSTYGATANMYAIGVHIFSWVIQFIGHGKFEGRAPALMDNILQATFLAPLFVWLEVLFHLGYRPELQARLSKSVQTEINKFNQSKQANGKANGKVNGAANGKAK